MQAGNARKLLQTIAYAQKLINKQALLRLTLGYSIANFSGKLLLRINLNNFIIVILWLLQNMGRDAGLIRNLGVSSTGCPSFLPHNCFYVKIHLPIQTYTRYHFCTLKFWVVKAADVGQNCKWVVASNHKNNISQPSIFVTHAKWLKGGYELHLDLIKQKLRDNRIMQPP